MHVRKRGDGFMTIDTQLTSRRGLLGLGAKGVAAVAGVGLAAASVGAAHAQESEPLVGSWLVAATASGAQPAPPRILVSLIGDGIALRTAPIQQAAPPPLGVDKMFIGTTHGAWSPAANGKFDLTFVGMAFDEAGKFLATQRVRVNIEVSESRDGFSGPFTTEFVAPDGQTVASVSGTVAATRIGVDPLMA
jgi:hypothetical protein